jgi:hypothetical protein
MSSTEIEVGAVHPQLRALGDPSAAPSGVPVVLADGLTWHLAHGGVARVLDPYRDRMDDQARLKGQVNMGDVFEVAHVLLRGNYQLTLEEAVTLLAEADTKALTGAVMVALYGDPSPHRTYTMWMMSSLYAAGLDPEKVPAEWLPAVLDQLVMTKRAVPIGEYTDAAIAAPRLAAMRARAEAYARASQPPPNGDQGGLSGEPPTPGAT